MKIKKRSVNVDNINVMLYESGTGKSEAPLLLLHGGGLDSAILSYGNIIPILGEKFHVIAPDLPGYGGTDKPDAPYTLEWYQEFLGKLIDVLGYNQVNLGGLSLGGGISVGYSLAHPNKVRKLVLIASYGLSNKIPYPQLTTWLMKHPHVYDSINKLMLSNKMFLKASLKKLLVNPDALTDDVVAKVMEVGRSANTDKAWRAFQLSEVKNQKLRTCYLNRLHELTMPVLLLTGKKDSLVPSKDVERASTMISNSQLVELDDCGHWLPRDRSHEFIQALKNFF
jgi:pimeloyl-ACP methyl ester carboxylesterase